MILSKSTFTETMTWMEQELSKARISRKEILTAQLLLEETFLRLSKGAGNAADFSVSVTLRRRFGDVSLRLESSGEQYNPLVEMTEVNEEDEDAYGLAILKTYRDAVSYSRKNGKNLVSIRIHKSASKDFRSTVIGIVLGIVCGLLLKETVSGDALEQINVTLAGSALRMFMNALSMTIGPMIFISVIAGITNMSNAADVGRMGGKLIVFSLVKLFVCTVLGVVFGLLFFRWSVRTGSSHPPTGRGYQAGFIPAGYDYGYHSRQPDSALCYR